MHTDNDRTDLLTVSHEIKQRCKWQWTKLKYNNLKTPMQTNLRISSNILEA